MKVEGKSGREERRMMVEGESGREERQMKVGKVGWLEEKQMKVGREWERGEADEGGVGVWELD